MSSKMRYAARVLGLLVLVAGAGTAMGAASVPLPPVVRGAAVPNFRHQIQVSIAS